MGRKKVEIKDKDVLNFLKKVKQKFRVEKVIWFGSRVRGDYLVSSDYDFILVSKKFRGIPFRKRIVKVLELTKKPWKFDVICYTPEEFEKKKKEICIVKEALEKGILLEI